MPLPDSNLPTSSLPWGREVEKRLETLDEAVRINEINNSARDATSQTNITNLLEIMADQVELLTYSTELAGSRTATFTTVFSEFTPDMRPLDINIVLNKPRRLLINYSTYYTIYMQTSATGTDTSAYGFDFKIYVDGIEVDSQYVFKANGKNVASNFIYDYDSINSTKLIPVSAGSHTISMTMVFKGTPPSGGSVEMTTSGDNLIVTVLQ